jgi:hypothetical protein
LQRYTCWLRSGGQLGGSLIWMTTASMPAIIAAAIDLEAAPRCAGQRSSPSIRSESAILDKEADPDATEDWKWRGVPVWYHAGMICTGETYKSVVKMTFAKGASLEDPAGLFNSSLDGKARRAIDIHEGDTIDEKALKALIRAAVALNVS